ncbi:MAG: YdcF family protein [Sarcina sp.]
MKIRKNLILGVSFIVYYLFLLISIGNNMINLSFLIVGIILLSINYYDMKYEKTENKESYLKWRKKISILLFTTIIGTVFIDTAIGIFAMNKNYKKTECIMILGAGLIGDKIPKILKTRLDGAIDFINKGDGYDFIVVSGGKGDDEFISEAEAMRKYLVDKGISNEKILLEDKSTSTYENFKFSKDIITKYTGENIQNINVKFFTNGFHTLRSYFLGKRLGFNELTYFGTKTPFYFIPYYYFREIFAFGKSIVFDK